MAFCPNCGKPVTEQASKCLACGNEFEPRAKSARFKGTMMMTPATAPQAPAKPAAASPAAQPAPPKPQPAPAPAAAAARPATPGPSKVAKATMLGTGGLGLVPPAAAAGLKAGAVPQPPPAAGATQPAAVSPPPAAPAPPSAEPPAAAAPEPSAPSAARTASAPREDSQRFLVGDPMAPAGAAQPSGRRGDRGDSDPNLPIQRTSAVLVIGAIGVLLIAAVGYAAARYMGLIQ